jgi:oxepin-CoA hydrolase/3-oxo-5,6-dehydrosuberyl-CoA semialdehyde dehydrogenase
MPKKKRLRGMGGEIFNQHQQAVALYSILTLVARQHGDFPA